MNFNNGLPQKVDLSCKKEMAVDFSEGNKMLEKLLLTSWKKGIETHACCNGHITSNGIEKPYINFVYDNQDFVLKFATYLTRFFATDKSIQIELTKRNFDKLFLREKTENTPDEIQTGLTIRLNTNVESEKSYYYQKFCDIIKHIETSLSQENYDETYKKVSKNITQIVQDFNWQNFDDSYYICMEFKPNLLLKNQFCITKYFNNNIHYFKFYSTELIQTPIGMDDKTALEFLSTQKRISVKNVERNL